MHGTHDAVVPLENGETLFEALQNPYEPLWLPGYGKVIPQLLVIAIAKPSATGFINDF